MKNRCKKTIVISIILLLIGVSVSSAISVDTKSPIVIQQSEEDCNCKEIDSRHLVRLERQLNRLEVYSKLLLVLSRDNPEIKEKIEELSDEISTLKEELTDDPPYPILCGILDNIMERLDNIIMKFHSYILERYNASKPGTLVNKIWGQLLEWVPIPFAPIILPIWFIGTFVLGCWEWSPTEFRINPI